MDTSLNVNAINNLEAGSAIYKQGHKADTVSFVLKGRVTVCNQGIKTIMGAGSFIGINDVYHPVYMSNYIANENVTLYTFQICKKEDIKRIMKSNSEYNGLLVCHLNMFITELSGIVTSLRDRADELFDFLDKIDTAYPELQKQDDLKQYESSYVFEDEELDYFEESSKLSADIHKAYFSNSLELTYLHISRQSELINRLIKESIRLAIYGKSLFEILIDDSEDCLFKVFAKREMDNRESGSGDSEIMQIIDKIIDQIDKTEKLYTEKSGTRLIVSRERIKEIYSSIIAETSESTVSTELQLKYSAAMAETAKNEMEGSLNRILEYADLDEDRKEEIRTYISEFKYLRDKTLMTENSRILRRNIFEVYYELYTKIFLKAVKDNSLNRIIELFLNYGYIDETLLTNDQCLELYYLIDQNDNKDNHCKVYTIYQWLKEIYAGRKEPSKNEFDLEYAENLRDMKKSRKVSPEEERDYLTNPDRKVEYEIKNMFKYNCRVVSGQISVFVPILHKDMMLKTMSKMLITANSVNEGINRLLAIDYSAFHREILYYDESKGIHKEYIVKQAFPDIILMPTVGYNAVMWQEIEGRKRDTSGRFVLPIFCDGDLFEQIIKLTGRFRFELCRTIEGISWNNIQEKSLTSEYADYVQFFNKNRDLSEDQKHKVKQQIQRGRNNIREIFMLDYMVWIQNESQGYLRLNKIVRGIMATYCPFVKDIRTRNLQQPLFIEAMSRYVKEKQKKSRECTLSIKKLEKENIGIPEELEETRRFYCDL